MSEHLGPVAPAVAAGVQVLCGYSSETSQRVQVLSFLPVKYFHALTLIHLVMSQN